MRRPAAPPLNRGLARRRNTAPHKEGQMDLFPKAFLRGPPWGRDFGKNDTWCMCLAGSNILLLPAFLDGIAISEITIKIIYFYSQKYRFLFMETWFFEIRKFDFSSQNGNKSTGPSLTQFHIDSHFHENSRNLPTSLFYKDFLFKNMYKTSKFGSFMKMWIDMTLS